MYKQLTEMGFECSQPMGAFYIFAKIPPFLDQDDNKLIYQLANEAKVAVTAGSNFGNKGGEGYLRFSYATSIEQIKEAMDRLAEFCKKEQNNA